MPLTPLAKRRATIAAVITAVVATVAFGVYAVKLWNDGSTPAPIAKGPSSDSRSGSFEESTGIGAPDDVGNTAGSAKSGLATGDPFANTVGDRKLYDVEVLLVSDGAMNVGYRFRNGKADGQQIAEKRLSIKTTVRGPLAVAQVGVQVLNNATYVTCSIFLDGIKVDTRTARKPGHVTICTA